MPVTFLVAVADTTGSELRVGEVSIQNGNPGNVNAGAVSFVPVVGSEPFAGAPWSTSMARGSRSEVARVLSGDKSGGGSTPMKQQW